MWMMGSQRETGNSALEIELRRKKTIANRERLRIAKESSILQRHYSQNMRKLSSLQRSIFVMVGKDPYPMIPKDEALFEYNHAGFCYKRNGQPRYMPTLQESNTRKIKSYTESKTRDAKQLSSRPAINVVSDSPQMSEILSNPELVQILCEIKNIALIMEDEALFSKFAIALQNSPRKTTLQSFEGPMDYLKQHRKNLIQEFFDIFKAEAEMRYYLSNDAYNNFDMNALDFNPQETKNTLQSQSQSFSNVIDQRKIEQWNKAVIEGLYKSQDQDLERASKLASNQGNGKQSILKNLDNLNLSIPREKAIGLLTHKYLQESKHNLNSLPPRNEQKHLQKQQRHQFDNFVRHLIAKIQVLDDLGQNMLTYKRKRPDRFTTLIAPFVKLLKKESLFSSLTDSDFKTVLDLEAEEQRSIKYFKVPGSPAQNTTSIREMALSLQKSQQLETNANNVDSKSIMFLNNAVTNSIISQAIGMEEFNNEEFTKEVQVRFSLNDDEELRLEKKEEISVCDDAAQCVVGSTRKAGCKACREKVRMDCVKMQKRDAMSAIKIQKDRHPWKISEIANWPHEYQETSSVLKIKENVKGLDEILKGDKLGRSAYLMQPPKYKLLKGGGATPKRRLFNPIEITEFSKASGIPQNEMKNVSQSGFSISKSSIPASDSAAQKMVSGTKPSLGKMYPIASKSKTSTTARPHRILQNHSTQTTKRNNDVSKNVDATKQTNDSTGAWTLKISKIDIMRLRHELESEAVNEKMNDFEEKLAAFDEY